MRDETFVEPVDLGECLYVSSTRGIKIEVWPCFDELNSQPENSFYLYRLPNKNFE